MKECCYKIWVWARLQTILWTFAHHKNRTKNMQEGKKRILKKNKKGKQSLKGVVQAVGARSFERSELFVFDSFCCLFCGERGFFTTVRINLQRPTMLRLLTAHFRNWAVLFCFVFCLFCLFCFVFLHILADFLCVQNFLSFSFLLFFFLFTFSRRPKR